MPVSIPHDAMLAEPKSETAPGGTNTGWYEGFDYLYQKSFLPGRELQDKRLVLEFEGVYHNAEVWLNGEKLCQRPYGYTNFYAELTDRLSFDKENEIRVIARNADQPNSRWYSGAGIYRPVTLWVGDKAAHIPCNGVRVRTLGIHPPRVRVEVDTSCPGELEVEIWRAAGCWPPTGWTARAKRPWNWTCPTPPLWSPESPQLCVCRVRFGATR